MLPLIIPCVCLFSIVFIAGGSWFRSAPSGDSLKGWVPHLPLFCVISPLSAYWPLFKEDGKWDSRASLSLCFFSLSDTSCCFTVYDAGREALREGDVWSLQRCKKCSHFPWWYAKIPWVASRAPSLSNPPPSLSFHQPSGAPEREVKESRGNRPEIWGTEEEEVD